MNERKNVVEKKQLDEISLSKKLLTLNQLKFDNNQLIIERFDLAKLIRGMIQSL